MLPEKVTQAIVEAVKQHAPAQHYKLFLFGSRALGKGSHRSDYDIGIEASEEIPVKTLFDIKDEIDEIPILQKIDLVDFSSVSGEFKKIAKQKIKVLYEQ